MDKINKLTNSEKYIYKFMTETKYVFELSIDEIAAGSFTSKATVSRFIHKMGFKNIMEWKAFFFNFNNLPKNNFLFPTIEKVMNTKNNSMKLVMNQIQNFNIDQEIVSIAQFLKYIKVSQSIILVGNGTSKLPVLALENYFSRSDKISFIASDYEILKQKIINSKKNDLIVLFSVSGNSEIYNKIISLTNKTEANFVSISSSTQINEGVTNIYLPKTNKSSKLKNNIIQLFFVDLITSLLE